MCLSLKECIMILGYDKQSVIFLTVLMDYSLVILTKYKKEKRKGKRTPFFRQRVLFHATGLSCVIKETHPGTTHKVFLDYTL